MEKLPENMRRYHWARVCMES